MNNRPSIIRELVNFSPSQIEMLGSNHINPSSGFEHSEIHADLGIHDLRHGCGPLKYLDILTRKYTPTNSRGMGPFASTITL